MNASVIVINYNGIGYLPDCLRSLRRLTSHPLEVLLVDNASTDGSVEFVRAEFPWVTVLPLSQNLGFAAANNIAATRASGTYLVFLNNDTKAEPAWLSELVAAADSDPQIAIVGGTAVDLTDRNLEVRVVCDVLGYGVNRAMLWQPNSPSMGPPEDAFHVPGFAMLVRRSVFEELGGFDEDYFMFMEDLDLTWRARLRGYRVVVARRAILYHKFGASLAGSSLVVDGRRSFVTTDFRRYYGERNQLRTLLKNYSLPTLVALLPVYLAHVMGEVLYFSVRGDWHVVFAYLRAVASNLADLSATLRKRGVVQATRRVRDWEVMRDMYKGSAKLLHARATGFRVVVQRSGRALD